MLKEVGASGQISLGKKYAGQLFDMVFYPDGRLKLVPMKAVPTVREGPAFQDADVAAAGHASVHAVHESARTYRVGDGWLTSERLAARKAAYERTPDHINAAHNQWALDNQDAIEAMNQRMANIGSMGTRIHDKRQAKLQPKAVVASDSLKKA
ncbi:MAG: hypothetical protein H7Z77_03660 [Chitinophagaceae bacterium]|nr:hypothetical protein [Polaromonas sp.]